MLSDIIRQIISSEPEFELAEVTGKDLLTAIGESRADALVTAALPDDETVAGMLRANPRLRVIAVADGGQKGWLWELRPHREPLGELSAEVLIEALRRPPVASPVPQRQES